TLAKLPRQNYCPRERRWAGNYWRLDRGERSAKRWHKEFRLLGWSASRAEYAALGRCCPSETVHSSDRRQGISSGDKLPFARTQPGAIQRALGPSELIAYGAWYVCGGAWHDEHRTGIWQSPRRNCCERQKRTEWKRFARRKDAQGNSGNCQVS